MLHFHYSWYLCILAICISVNLQEISMTLIFFRVNWLSAQPVKPARPSPWPCLEGRAKARARTEPSQAHLFRARPITIKCPVLPAMLHLHSSIPNLSVLKKFKVQLNRRIQNYCIKLKERKKFKFLTNLGPDCLCLL